MCVCGYFQLHIPIVINTCTDAAQDKHTSSPESSQIMRALNETAIQRTANLGTERTNSPKDSNAHSNREHMCLAVYAIYAAAAAALLT